MAICRGVRCCFFSHFFQIDASVDRDARTGAYRIVYVTPEKFTGAGFMSDMATLYAAGKLAFIAVDEVHTSCLYVCVCVCVCACV